ncbi:MAG: heterocyst formation ABC transporter subunit HepA [Synechococcus sp.]
MLKNTLAVVYDPLVTQIKKLPFWKRDRFLLRELKHFYWIAILAIAFTLISALFGGSTVGLIALFLQGLTDPQSPSFETGLSWLDAWLSPAQASTTTKVYRITSVLLIISWLQALFLYLGQLFSSYTRIQTLYRLRKSIFQRLKSLEFSFYVNERSGNLLNTITTELQKIEQLLKATTLLMIAAFQAIAYIVAMFFISWQLSLFAFMLLSLLFSGVSQIRSRVRKASFNIPTANQRVTSGFVEFINGIKTVHSYETFDYEQKRIDKNILGAAEAEEKIAKFISMIKPLSQGLGSTALVIVLAVAYQVLSVDSELQAAILITFLFALFRALPFVYQVLNTLTRITSFRGSVDKVNQLLAPKNKPIFQNGTIPFPGLKKSVDFVGIEFSYVPGSPILNKIDLSFTKGKTVALVGSSGAGKSTIVDLMLRLIKPNSGQILFDGVDLADIEISTLRRKMAIVSQDTFIFNATVKENIAYGLDSVDNKAVLEAAKQANALDFILEMPEGFETQLGDRGVRLSGGQRQRISIARALVRDPEILILDEATSALDSVTEQLIQESLDELVKGRTVIMVAHRLSTIFKADKVVVLDSGRVVEEGTYQELLDKQGQLWEFHQMQYK